MDNLEILSTDKIMNNRLSEFFKDSLRNVSMIYIAWLFLATVLSAVTYIMFSSPPLTSIIPNLLVYYLVLIVHIIFRFRAGGKSVILVPDILFLLFYTLFHLGYVTFFALNLAPYSDYVFYFESSIPKSLFIINLGLIGFIFGFEIAGISNSKFAGQRMFKIPSASWCVLGLFFMILALVMHFAGLILVGPDRIIEKGYSAFSSDYLADVWPASLLLNRSVYIMAFGLVIYIVGSAFRHNKIFKSKLALIITIVFTVIVILEGDRGPILKFFAPILMVRHYFIKRIKIRYLVLMFAGVMFLFAAISVVRTIALDPAKMIQEYKSQKSAGMVGWQSSFIEMGGSFLIVDIVASEVPSSVKYWKGQSWAAAVLHAVPFLYGYFFRHGWVYVNPSEWVTYTYFSANSGGKAFTIAAEGYLNFGLIGVFIETMLCGLFIRWLMIKFSRNPSAVWCFIMLGCLAAMFMVVRNELYSVSDVCFQIFLIGGLLSLISGRGEVLEIVDDDYSIEYGQPS